MLRYLAVAALAVFLVGPAAAAVTVDPNDPTMSSAVVFGVGGAQNVTQVSGEFTLTNDSIVSATMSAVGTNIELSLFQITSVPGGDVLANGDVIPVSSGIAFASIADVPLMAGTYALVAIGNFTGALSAEVSAVVPLPAAAVLFGTALAGLGIYRRVRKTA